MDAFVDNIWFKAVDFYPKSKKIHTQRVRETPKTNNNGIATKTKPFQPT